MTHAFAATSLALLLAGTVLPVGAQDSALRNAPDSALRNAPASAKAMKNPATDAASVEKGRAAYAANCAACHGGRGEGQANIPAVAKGATQQASDGELFWFITRGDIANGMPAWSSLPDAQRWQIVGFLKSGELAKESKAVATVAPAGRPGATISDPPPPAPFTDFRFEAPGTVHRIRVADLPAPYATATIGNAPHIVTRPDSAWPKAPAGFKVELFAAGLEKPRLMRTAPNGDIFVAETQAGRIHLLRGIGADGKAQQSEVFATGLHQPFGMAFYPSGKNPQWLYVGDTGCCRAHTLSQRRPACSRRDGTTRDAADWRWPFDARHSLLAR